MDAPKYKYLPPQEVEAYQWLPDNEEHTRNVMWWLVRRRVNFQVCLSYPYGIDSSRIIAFESNGGGYDYVAFPGDWIVRKGAQAYEVYEAGNFETEFQKEEVEGES